MGMMKQLQIELEEAIEDGLTALPKDRFLKLWHSLLVVYPEMEPAHDADLRRRTRDAVQEVTPFEAEANRRFEAGGITDEELYPRFYSRTHGMTL